MRAYLSRLFYICGSAIVICLIGIMSALLFASLGALGWQIGAFVPACMCFFFAAMCALCAGLTAYHEIIFNLD